MKKEMINTIQEVIDYIEKNILEQINYKELAENVYLSHYHLQRMFSIVCGYTIGEYIRLRKMSLAGQELLSKNNKVIDIAIKYGYQTNESFSRAFKKFHGILPSKVKVFSELKYFAKIELNYEFTKGEDMYFKVEERQSITLVGYKKRFVGVPFGQERLEQEKEFVCSTRAKQWLLLKASCNYCNDYFIVDNVGDNGYDFYIAYELDQSTIEDMFNNKVTGVNFIENMGFEIITIPKRTYAVFQTEKKKRPIIDYTNLRKRIVEESNGKKKFSFIQAPEIVIMHWRPKGNPEEERYIEICLPIA